LKENGARKWQENRKKIERETQTRQRQLPIASQFIFIALWQAILPPAAISSDGHVIDFYSSSFITNDLLRCCFCCHPCDLQKVEWVKIQESHQAGGRGRHVYLRLPHRDLL